MSAKTYKNKLAEPLVQKLKSLVKTALIRCFEAYDSYYRLNITNSNLHRENERLTKTNEKLAGENENLRAENKNYKLLKKAFGSKQMDSLLEQAKAVQQSKQRGKHFRNNQEETLWKTGFMMKETVFGMQSRATITFQSLHYLPKKKSP